MDERQVVNWSMKFNSPWKIILVIKVGLHVVGIRVNENLCMYYICMSKLHSASSVQILSSTRKFNTMLPFMKIRPLNILSASSVNLHGITNSNDFHSNLRIRLVCLL